MSDLIAKTAERIIPERCETKEEYLLYLRHLFAYEFVRENVGGESFVLEVGCGEGYGTYLLSKSVTKIIGLDVDKGTIAYASRKYGRENCEFKAFGGERIPFDDGTFDVVVSFQVIEHVKDVPGYLSEILRVLKSEGRFFLTTPNRTYRLRPGQKPWNKFHLREYYPDDLRDVLKTRFGEVKVWGIRGKDEVQAIELERVKQGSALGYIIFRMIKVIPEPVRIFIRRVLRMGAGSKGMEPNGDEMASAQKNADRLESSTDKGFFNKYSTSDYYIIRTNIFESLDLLGMCRKS